MKNNWGKKMKNGEKDNFYCEKAKQNLKTWSWSYFWTAHGPIFRAKNKKICKVERITLVDFF